MGYKIAFDPSVNDIGYCIFKNGRAIEAKTFHKPNRIGTNELLQYRWVKQSVDELLWKVRRDDPSIIQEICVEEFVKGYHINSRQRKCDGARAIIIAISYSHCIKVSSVGKGTKKGSKEQAQTLAERAGLKCDEHAADAYYIGLLAGFDR